MWPLGVSTIPDYWLYLSAWLLLLMSNNISRGGAKIAILFSVFLSPPSASRRISVHAPRSGPQMYASRTFPRPSPLRYIFPALSEKGIDSPPGSEDVSPCMDWIDNARLNIALRQEAGAEDIFRSVYSAMTWTLPQLNDQMEERKGWRGGTIHCGSLGDTQRDCKKCACRVENDHQLCLIARRSKISHLIYIWPT